jgi:hypothetical protein
VQGIEGMKNLQKVVDKASRLKRSLNDFMGFGVEKKLVVTSPSGDQSTSVDPKLSMLTDQVEELQINVFTKHSELQALCYHNCEELTRGMAYMRGFFERRVKDSAKELDEKLKDEIAKNKIKDKAFKELLQRVEALESTLQKDL